MENIKPLDTEQLKEVAQKFTPFLNEVRKRLVFTLTIFLLATSVGFVFYENIIGFLLKQMSIEGVNIVFTSPFQFINLAISCGVAIGLIVAFPVIFMQIIGFLKPALKRKELRTIVRFIPFSVFLFLCGFSFGALIMKWQIEIFLSRAISLGIGNILDISGLLSTVFLTSALMGIGFQFPIILLILTRLGIINRHHLTRNRRWVYLGSFVFALFLPPDSILADIILALPLILLYETSLVLDKLLGMSKK